MSWIVTLAWSISASMNVGRGKPMFHKMPITTSKPYMIKNKLKSMANSTRAFNALYARNIPHVKRNTIYMMHTATLVKSSGVICTLNPPKRLDCGSLTLTASVVKKYNGGFPTQIHSALYSKCTTCDE